MNDYIPQSDQSPLATRFYVSDCVHLVARYWPALFIVPALLMAAVVLYHISGTKYYGASASVYMDPSFGSRIQTESGRSTTPVLEDDEEALFSMEETICSDAMILRVLKKLNLTDDRSFLPSGVIKRIEANQIVTDARIIDSVRKRYSAGLINATRILKVYVEDKDPERAVKLAETFVSEFVLFLQEQKVESEIRLKENLLKQAEIVKSRAIEAEQNLNSFRNEHSDFLVEQDSNLFARQMQEAGTDLNKTNAELIKINSLLTGLDQIDANENPVRILNLSKGEYAVDFDQVLTKRADALVNLQDAQQRFGPSHSSYRAAYNQFKSIDQSIRNHAQEIKNSTRTRQSLLQQQKASLEQEMAMLREKFNDYKSASAEFRGLNGTVEREWSLYEKINDRILSLGDQADLSPNLATPLGDPIVPYNPTRKYLISIAAAAILLSAGWIVVVGTVLIMRGLPFTNSRQIQDILDVPVAGQLSKSDLSKPGVLSSLPLLTGSSKVVHLTSAAVGNGAANVCQMITEAYLEQGAEVTILQIADSPGVAEYEFRNQGVKTYLVLPSQIEVRKIRLAIRYFLNENPNRTIIIDSTGVSDQETKLALAKITNATVILVKENSVTRDQAKRWFQRFKKEAGNILALYQSTNFPMRGARKALPMRPATETFQLK
ncbi:MAG: hypothetical protein P1V20_16440 [Verrucomicrobiales bacterium]|nr:hypothetical protein [Verrucomicrobiales bacterium]